MDKGREPARSFGRASAEVIGAVGAATGLVALLHELAPTTGLGVIYLLAVLLVAVRSGQVAALATALLSVLVFNFFFLEPHFRLTIASSGDVVALAVFLAAALVVSRLAATARSRASEAERQAQAALAREREANALATTASAVLAGRELSDHRAAVGEAVASATAGAVRLSFSADPPAIAGRVVVPLESTAGPAWLIGRTDDGWEPEALERLRGPLARLLEVARARGKAASEAAEAEASRRADVAKTALLHAISHDLRSPLTAISAAAAGLRGPDLGAADREALLSAVDAESARLSRLVDDLLDLSRIEADAVEPQLDWCDLYEVAARAVAQVGERHRHPIELELAPDLPLVRADPVQLERVFSNLLDNAVKFSPERVPVRVTGGVGAGRVTVRVTDRGRGIPLSRHSQVFEPFFRGRSDAKGSGLGLAICRGFVEANGGEIRLQSDAGQGTSFAVSFEQLSQPAKTL